MFIYMRNLLEKVLEDLQEADLDNDEEITKLKILFIRLDHHITRQISA